MFRRLADRLWWGLHRDDIEEIVTATFDTKLRPAMDEAYEVGFKSGIEWLLTALLKETFIEHLPELEEWARDQRALIEEQRR